MLTYGFYTYSLHTKATWVYFYVLSNLALVEFAGR